MPKQPIISTTETQILAALLLYNEEICKDMVTLWHIIEALDLTIGQRLWVFVFLLNANK